MAGAGSGATGPDLSLGVALSSLEEGRPLLGHRGEEAVFVVRLGEEVVAVSATCTHYGGPLAEGLVTGETLRCPWHHACFLMRTGEAVGAPALKPLTRWRCRVRGGVVYVGEREPRPPGSKRATGPPSVVIIGAGAAGHAAVEALRGEGYVGPITVVDPDVDAPYDRPNLSKDYLAGRAPEEWLPLRPRSYYAEQGITRVDEVVTAIDTSQRTVRLGSGSLLSYGALLLATGAAPIRPPIAGSAEAHVHVLRSLADSRSLIGAAASAQRVVIAGASFIGMEAAAALRARGVAVTVVAPEAVPFEKTLGPELGAILRRRHEQNGVAFRLGRTVQETGAGWALLDDGTRLHCDVVLLGVGVRPVLNLAEAAGLAVDGGVLVDAFLETSCRGVFAAGDIARYPDVHTGERVRVEHWVVAQRQGQTAARNMLGARAAFASVPFFWTTQYDLPLAYVGHAASWTRVEVDGQLEAGDGTVTYYDGDRIAAVATIGRDRESLQAEVAMEQRVRGMVTACA